MAFCQAGVWAKGQLGTQPSRKGRARNAFRKAPREPGQGWQCRKGTRKPEAPVPACQAPETLRDLRKGGPSSTLGLLQSAGLGVQVGERRHLGRGLQPPAGQALPAGCPCQPILSQEAQGTEKRPQHSKPLARSRDQSSGLAYLPELRRYILGSWHVGPSRPLRSPLLPAQVSFLGPLWVPK